MPDNCSGINHTLLEGETESSKRQGTQRTALLWNTHIWCKEIEDEFKKLISLDYPGSPDVWLVLDAKIPQINELAGRYKRCFIIDPDDLFRKVSYPRFDDRGILYHSHFPLLSFFLSHREYDYYWFIEFDVRYTGEWGFFLRSFEPYTADFITSHIRRYEEEPLWPWWYSIGHPEKMIEREKYLRSFNVIFRISNQALEYIDREQRDGWQGFNEVTLPTLLYHGGYYIMDFGGKSDFTPLELMNKTYTSYSVQDGFLSPFCTMAWRPSRGKPGFCSNKLYHSIKPPHMILTPKQRRKYLYRWIKNFIHYKKLALLDFVDNLFSKNNPH